jgi:PAS domain-containing protein
LPMKSAWRCVHTASMNRDLRLSMVHHVLTTVGERDGLWDWNLVSRRVHFSPRWMSMIGCEEHEVGNSPEEWLGRVHPEDQERVRGEIERHLLEGDGF